MTSRDIRFQFLEEAQEHINKIESVLLGAGTKQTIPGNQLDAILRASHSLKGGAAMMGYEPLSSVAHRLEDFLKILKNRRSITIDTVIEELLLKIVDLLNHLVHWYCTSKGEIDANWLINSLNPLIENLQEKLGLEDSEEFFDINSFSEDEDMAVLLFQSEVENCLQHLEALVREEKQYLLKEEFRLAAQELGGLGEMLQLDGFSELCYGSLDLIEREEDTLAIAPEILAQWRRAQSLVIVGQARAISLFPDNIKVAETEARESESDNNSYPDRTLRVSVELLEDIDDRFGELSLYRHSLESQLRRLRYCLGSLRQRLGKLDHTSQELNGYYTEQAKIPLAAIKSDTFATRLSFFERMYFDSLEMDDYSNVHPAFTEVKEGIFQLYEAANDLETYLDETDNVARDIRRTSQLIQTKLDRVRMSPLGEITNSLKRALRNLTLKHGKEVQLKVIGASLLIDRTILNGLQDPLLHLIRNAFDHGIEDGEERLKRGKPPDGTIILRAGRRGNQTVITVSDDGGGINLEKIKVKALEIGLSAREVESADEQDLINLIFEPGFTTASAVTDISGRGVGMDIVRTQVTDLQGTISAYTKAELGTTFTITLPTCLSVIRVFLVEIRGVLLAVPTNTVDTMIMPTSGEIERIERENIFYLEGEEISIINLKNWFNCRVGHYNSDDEHKPSIDSPTIFVAGKGKEKVGIWSERYWGEQEVTIRPLEGKLKLPQGFAGCTILGNGRVVPLLDLAGLHHSQPTILPEIKSTESDLKNTLLIVDDSVTVRRLLAQTLEKAGYRVEQAKDGQEALEKLQKGLLIQAVMCDIEMPRLDGYGFLAHVKADVNLQHIPVLMLTSRSSDKHSSIAKHLGASAYFSKPFQERDLLQTLQSLLIKESS